jgi:acetoin utilization protein AcuB
MLMDPSKSLATEHAMKPRVRDYMTHDPRTIGADETLMAAHRTMRAFSVRHLPVIDGEHRPVGIVTERDLRILESFPQIDPLATTVRVAMTSTPFTVQPGDALDWVAAEMGKRRVGSAVVIEDGRVVGMFTTTDAMRLLCDALGCAHWPTKSSRWGHPVE